MAAFNVMKTISRQVMMDFGLFRDMLIAYIIAVNAVNS